MQHNLGLHVYFYKLLFEAGGTIFLRSRLHACIGIQPMQASDNYF